MKITKINIKIKEKYFVKYDGLNNEKYEKELYKELKDYLDNNKNFQIIESGKIKDVYSNGKKNEDSQYNNYSGYFVKYYEGLMVIDGSNVSMKINLNKRIIDLALKEAGGEIKKLVKKEYEEFENQLYQLIDKTEKKNIFGNFVISKFKKLKEAILNNSNKNQQ